MPISFSIQAFNVAGFRGLLDLGFFLHRSPETPDGLTQALSHFREALCAEDQKYDPEYYDQLLRTDAEHEWVPLKILFLHFPNWPVGGRGIRPVWGTGLTQDGLFQRRRAEVCLLDNGNEESGTPSMELGATKGVNGEIFDPNTANLFV